MRLLTKKKKNEAKKNAGKCYYCLGCCNEV